MMFREPAERPQASGRVIHGPFPVRAGTLGMAACFSFLAAVFVLIALVQERLVCPAHGMCTIDKRAVFAREDIKGVRVLIETGSKNAKYGVVTLDLASSPTPRKMMRVESDQAEEDAAAIRAALASGAPIDVTLHGPYVMFALGIALGIAGLVAWYAALSKMGRFDLVLDRDGATMHVRRSLFSIPLGSRSVRIDAVREVVIERSNFSPFLRQKYEPPTPVARLCLKYRNGEEMQVERGMFPGNALHYRAASALRAALLLPPNEADDTALAAIPMRTTAMGNRLMFAWIGITTGSLLGMALLGLSLALLGWVSLRGNIEGWMVAAGMIPGAVAGAAVAFHATRPRLPR